MRRGAGSRPSRRRFLDLLGAATAGVSLAGCTGDDDDADDAEPPADDDDDADDHPIVAVRELTITQREFIFNPDPHDHLAEPFFNIFDQVYEPIFTITPELEFAPGLVREWEHVEGGAELTIRDDAVFHDGTAVRATDVAYSYDRQIDPEQGIESDQAVVLSSILGAEALDDVTVFLEYEVAPSLAEFEYASYGRVVPRGFFEEHGHPISGADATVFNGTGPLRVLQYEPPQRKIVMEPFEEYWGDPVTFDSVVFDAIGDAGARVDALRDGDSRVIDDVPPQEVEAVNEEPGIEVRTATSLWTVFLLMKTGVPPFDSLEFRRAMNYAVDNRKIIEEALGGFGEPATQPVADGVFGFNPDLEPYEQDVSRAAELVEASGYGGIELTLHTPSGRYVGDADVADIAADQIDQLDNVECDVTVVAFDSLVSALINGYAADDMPFALFGWGSLTGDADYTLDRFFVEDGLFESMRNAEISEAVLHSQHVDDREERQRELQAINADLRELAPWVFSHTPERRYGVDSEIAWSPRVDGRIDPREMS